MNLETIRSYLAEEILGEPDRTIGSDEDLLLSELLDSLGVTRLVAFLEERFGVTIPAEDITLENFATLSKIDAYLDTRS